MDKQIKKNLEIWQKKLLDMGMRNQLINFKEPKKSSLYITAPDDKTLFRLLVSEERILHFPHMERYAFDEGDEEVSIFDTSDETEKVSKPQYEEVPGDVKTDKTTTELQSVLKTLRSRAKTANEEQGVNILYLSFGFLEWSEASHSDVKIKSPLVLVPVSLDIESITSPYTVSLHEDEIVLNPTLAYKMENDFGVMLPEFDAQTDDLDTFFAAVEKAVKGSGWNVRRRVSLSLLSFLKINMYKDLQTRGEMISGNAVIRSLCGVSEANNSAIASMDSYDHDALGNPVEIFQVMDADSSQLDAIELSKRGASFVLQGPPGTGKSQTITNIIAEAMADGKKVLFVSEKMAALDVVHKRLAATGLADFCLVLHSHKANKKELLNSLGSTLKLKDHPISVKSDAMLNLRKLEEKRRKLNAYCSQLHQKILPLEQSAFEANGIIASLEHSPYVAFDVSQLDIEHMTKAQLMDLRLAVQEYAKSVGNLTEVYTENTWRNSTLQKVTYALAHDIKSTFDRLALAVQNLDNGVESFCRDLRLKNALTYDRIPAYIEAVKFGSQSTGFPEHWLSDPSFAEYDDLAKRKEQLEKQQADRKKIIESKFYGTAFDLPAEKLMFDIDSNIEPLRAMLSDRYESTDSIIEGSRQIQETIRKGKKALGEAAAIAERIAEELGTSDPSSLEEFQEFCSMLRILSSDFKPDKSWFSPSKWTREAFDKAAAEAQQQIQQLSETKNRLLETYADSVLSFEYKPVLKRFSSDYTSAFRALNGDFRADNKALRLHQKDPSRKLAYDVTLENLNLLKKYHDELLHFEECSDEYRHLFGPRFDGINTDFDSIRKAAEDFRTAWQYLGGAVSRNLKVQLLSGDNVGKYCDDADDVEAIILGDSVRSASAVIAANESAVEKMLLFFDRAEEKLAALDEAVDTVYAAAKLGTGRADCCACLSDIDTYQKQEQVNRALEKECSVKFGTLYDPKSPAWPSITEQIHWVQKFLDLRNELELTEQYTRGISSDERIRELSGAFAEYLDSALSSTQEDVRWLAGLFAPSEKIQSRPLPELNRFILRCRNNLKGLEYWVDFCHAKAKCEKAGLTDFIQKSLDMELQPAQIEAVFLKRFEHFWLDMIMPQIPAVEAFRSRRQNDLIAEFRALDTEQFQIARARVRASLIQHLPNVGGLTSGRDEVSILRREMEKQRKIMPVRKLFASIPNLLPRLKPCLMMSPLSVSLFLQDENYQFDMVIFDEASQVRTENAIGAISRGKQVIIAGDIHQLPPTSFFSVSVSGDDEYDEENDTDSFESVLSEARTVLPEEELKWHYRSRNEKLIAFSNHKIYRDSLVTFPSPGENPASEGVEYIYVPNGIYERSGKRVNQIEAKKVVDVIFEHVRSYPHRSMGVITFSEAQMRCVENELIHRRLEHPEYEEFFAEGKEESFFIKNLENVQGDERDVILLSIGYAKSNSLETLKMNFGPLNKEGGYRRLNVAVTRAKYAVKLIGSILPSDMMLSETTPRGVKLLHDYIDFAQNGVAVLKNEIELAEEINTESPFEEAVYDYLATRGYSISTQVGCSGYRIDMAVRHPVLHDRFVVGIECDGAMYHSSRTARERDRLRQNVLESMGWKFIRIWSTDWIKDPVSEGQRVLREIQKAIDEFGTEPQDEVKTIPFKEASDYYDADAAEPEQEKVDPRFSEYREMTFIKSAWESPLPAVAKIIDGIVKGQSPVHIDLVCKQVAPMFCNERVTVKVRSAVDRIIRLYSSQNDWVIKGQYLWDKHQSEIHPRLPSSTFSRTIDFIAKEELAEAMYILIDTSFGMEQNALYEATARTFGFQRTTDKMRDAFDEAYSLLISKRRIIEKSGKLSLAD